MVEQEYISVEIARERLGISHREMSILLEAKALRFRQDIIDKTIRLICTQDVAEVSAHLVHFRQEEKERIQRFTTTDGSAQERDAGDISYFTFSDSDLMMLLLAAVSYFDIERDIYLGAFDERADICKNLNAISKLYSRLEKENKDGRPMSEIVTEIHEQQPDQKSRNEVLRYLMDKARQEKT